MSYQNFISKLFSLFLLTVFFTGGLVNGSAQVRIGSSQPKPAPKARCTGGWSGIITYKKTLSDSYNEKKKNVGAGTTHHITSREYKYEGRIILNGANPQVLDNKSVVSLNDVEKKFRRTEKQDTCFYDGKGSREQWSETTDSYITNAVGDGTANVFLNVNEAIGTYSFNFRLPDANGKETRDSKTTRGGWCSEKNNEPYGNSNNNVAKINGTGTNIDDAKINPERPDVLSGSKTWDTSVGAVKSFVHTVTWTFTRCPQSLLITDLKFEHPDFPDWDAWKEINLQTGTIDGNPVKVKAKVLNLSDETKFATVNFLTNLTQGEYVMEKDELLKDGSVAVRLDAGEEREVEVIWDTSGRSWSVSDQGNYGKSYTPTLHRNIRAEVLENGKRENFQTAPIKIAPKPLVLVHGFYNTPKFWDLYQNWMTLKHSYDWRAFAVGERPEHGAMFTGKVLNPVPQAYKSTRNAVEVEKYVKFVREDRNAWHIDMVAHSSGGLAARRYIHSLMPESPDKRPVVSHLVMLGVPNSGTLCADMLVSAYNVLAEGVREITIGEMIKFNKLVTNRRGVKFSAVAGRPIPGSCAALDWGDGVVPSQSAIAITSDYSYSDSLHADLISAKDFNDFVVPRLAIDKNGNHAPEANQRGFYQTNDEENTNNGFGAMFVKASYQKSNSDDEETPLIAPKLAKDVKLAPNQTTEIEIPVAQSQNFGLTLLTAPEISATLTDEKGAIIGKSEANSPESKSFFRSFVVDKAISNGVWKLKLENKSATEQNVLIAGWTDTNPLRFSLTTGKPNVAGQIQLQAKLTNNNAPLTGVEIKANLLLPDGNKTEIKFFDDGRNGDGAAGDGVYGAITVKLTAGVYTVEATAQHNGQTRVAVGSINLAGGAKPPTQPIKVKK